MLENKMAEIIAREAPAVVDAGVVAVTKAETSPEPSAPTTAPEPIPEEEPKLTLRESQNRYLQFQAGLPKVR